MSSTSGHRTSVTGIRQYDMQVSMPPPNLPDRATSQPVHIAGVGSKHAGLFILVAALTAPLRAPVTLVNCPCTSDVEFVLDHARHAGAHVERTADRVVISGGPTAALSSRVFTRSTRVSVLQLGSALARFGEVDIPSAFGGCRLGERPIDEHLSVLQALGAEFHDSDDGVVGRRPLPVLGDTPRVVAFSKVSTMATVNALLVGAFAGGGSIELRGIHARPEILQVVQFLTVLGCRIDIRNDIASIVPAPMTEDPVEFRIMDDLDYALGVATLAWAAGRPATIAFRNPFHYPELDVLADITAGDVIRVGAILRVQPTLRRPVQEQISITTGAYPALNSDAQPILAAAAASVIPTVRVTDTRFADRFRYAEQLRQAGYKTNVDGQTLIIHSQSQAVDAAGPSAPITSDCPDLRAAFAALVIAVGARRSAVLSRAAVLERGYPGLVDLLRKLGFGVIVRPVPEALYVAGIVITGDAVLLQQRSTDAGVRNSGKVSLFGGRADPGESPDVAVRRELYEELAFPGIDLRPFGRYHLTAEDEGADLLCAIYTANAPDGWAPVLAEGEAIVCHPLSDKRLPMAVTPLTQAVIRDLILARHVSLPN